MASNSTLNAKNLAALGAERLAQLLVEISTGDAVAKRKLRLALAGAEGPRQAAREIAKRLTSIAKARSFVDWHNQKVLVKDLQAQRSAIMDQVAPNDPAEALALLWRFMALADSVFQRLDDSNGTVIDIFYQACEDLATLAKAAGAAPQALAQQVFDALQDNGYGQYDGLIAKIAPALGPSGLGHLKTLFEELAQTPVPVPPKSEWREVAWGPKGPLFGHELEESARQSLVDVALKDIADAQGDVDSFIARYDAKTRRAPAIAADIAQRLLAAGRAAEALGFIERAEVDEAGWIPPEWQDARLAALEALDRKSEAQAFRWTCFLRNLSVPHLRAYLKRLPDFADAKAEDRAMAHAAGHPEWQVALAFFLKWPALDQAARLLINRKRQLDGHHYEILAPAGEALAEKHPLAATLALRAMIDFALTEQRYSRYGYAARHLVTCANLAKRIANFQTVEPHTAYLARLKAEHSKKTGFWSKVQL